jgi:hypothetical protein
MIHKKLWLMVLFTVSLIFSTVAFADGHMYGQVSSGGSINMHDDSGNHYHGHVSSGGSINMHDDSGNHYHGQVSSGGSINMHD